MRRQGRVRTTNGPPAPGPDAATLALRRDAARDRGPPHMGHTAELLSAVQAQIDAEDVPLKEARVRLQLVRDLSKGFTGSLRSYASGSLAHHTMNEPVTDGDGGLVLDRRCYPKLGPEG